MKIKNVVIVVSIIMLLTLSGCKDIAGTYRPGNFGNTPEESQMLQGITEKYGDLTSRGDPRFLELTMTTNIVNFVPVNRVIKYSKDAPEFYFWFVYDNFNNDELKIDWIYEDADHLIHTFVSKAGENFGRGSFILEKPDDGWPVGNYKVVIRGRNVEEIVRFEVIDGPTVSTPLDFLEDLDMDYIPQETVPSRVSEALPHERFLEYNDANFPISFMYPNDFFTTLERNSMVFESYEDEMYYVLSVAFDETQDGYSSADEVMRDYYDQLSPYGPMIVREEYVVVNGRTFKEFVIEYFLEEEYRNEYLVAKSDGYYYIIQFIMPARLNREGFIGEVKYSIFIDGNDELSSASSVVSDREPTKSASVDSGCAKSWIDQCNSWYEPSPPGSLMNFRNGCYEMHAIEHKCPELCSALTDIEEEKIILCKAKASDDPAYCAKLEHGSYDHYSCYSHIAEALNNPSYCDEIDTNEASSWRGACLVPFR